MMAVNGKTRICGLIGNPVEHTLSPIIHNTLAGKLGHNLVYVPFCVENDSVREAVRGAHALHILGLNVTVPYKRVVMDALTEVDSLAQKIGAVNTLVRSKQGYIGYNTDMSGLYRALQSEGIKVKGEEILLLGAGGAAGAAAFMCTHYGAKRVYLLNRTFSKAAAVAEEVNKASETDCVVPMQIDDYKKLPKRQYLAIQGTSVGLYPNMDEAVILEKDFYRRVHTGYDLVYSPSRTKFMSLVEKEGGAAYNGLKMLLYQGIDAYELWNGIRVTEAMAAELYEILKKETGIHG